jgi:hypothetical protein
MQECTAHVQKITQQSQQCMNVSLCHGIGAMRQPTLQTATASIQIQCNLYGSHTVVFTIKQTTSGRQYLDRMTQTLKELKDITKCLFPQLVKKET